jgi:RNA polymerase sigma factor (sigma-70 family)
MGKHRGNCSADDEFIRRIFVVARLEALRRGASEYEAQEVAQLTAFKIWRDQDRPHIQRALRRGGSRWDGYVRRAACNTHFDLVRSHQRRLQRQERAATLDGLARTDATPHSGADIERYLAESAVAAAIMTLPPRQRKVAARIYLEQWSVSEIADDMGIQPQTVRKLLRTAQAKLRTVVNEDELQIS